MTGVTEYLWLMTGKEINHTSYTDGDKYIHQLWYMEDGVKYGQEYYRDDGEAVDVDMIIEEVESFPKVSEGTEFPRKEQ